MKKKALYGCLFLIYKRLNIISLYYIREQMKYYYYKKRNYTLLLLIKNTMPNLLNNKVFSIKYHERPLNIFF